MLSKYAFDKYEFGATLYDTRDQMLDAIAENWLTAYGVNTTAYIQEALADPIAGASDAMARECIGEWGLNVRIDGPTHMGRFKYDEDDLIAAFDRLRAKFAA